MSCFAHCSPYRSLLVLSVVGALVAQSNAGWGADSVPKSLAEAALAATGQAEKETATQADSEDGGKDGERQEKKQSAKKGKVRMAQLVLSSDMPESPGVTSPFGDMQLDLQSMVQRIEKGAKDHSIQGLVLTIDNPTLGRGKVNELREAIRRFRNGGKKVFAQLEMAMPEDYLLASACDEIIMPESGVLVLPGVRADTMFFRGTLAKLGIKADFLHMGDAKGAAEVLTRRSFSKPVRENLTSMIDDLYEQMVETIAKDRDLTEAKVIELIDQGLITAEAAKEAGLIDRTEYPHQLRESLGKHYDAQELVYVENYGKKKIDTDFSGPTGLLKLLSAMSGGSSSSGSGNKKIAVVYAVGPIVTGKSQQDLFGSSSMGSTTIVDALRKAAKDDKVAAIVLRVDSPGGSAIASDLMWGEIQTIEKPVVTSMGNVAASGGYYIAMGTDHIIAEPTTITGSIGVVGGKLAVKGLYEQLGIGVETIARGKNSGIFSGTTGFSKSEREAFAEMMEVTYDQFTSKAAAGRKMDIEALRKLAGGRVYTGRQAKENGLVDELGTLHDAIAKAKQLAGLTEKDEVRIESLPEPTDFFETLFGNTDAEKEVRIDLGAISPELKALGAKVGVLQQIFREPVALMLPYHLEIK